MYAVNMGLDTFHGIQTGPVDARDLGEVDDKPALRTRIDWNTSFVPLHGKSVARLRRINNA